MARSLFMAGVLAAGVYAQSTPDPKLTGYQHLGCVAIKPGTFPQKFNLGQLGCTSSCSTNGDIIAFQGSSCVCDRRDLSPNPIPYQVTKVDNSLCNQWCDPADKTQGTCGGATIHGWPTYDLYKRNNARVVFVPFPGQATTPVAPGGGPGQTPAPVPNDPGHKPGDVFHDCPPNVVNCPYRTMCPGGNCGGVQPVPQPVPQPCRGCSPSNTTTNWTAPGCPSGGCSPGQGPVPVPGNGGGSGGQGSSGGNGGSGANGGQNGGQNGQGGQGGQGGSSSSGQGGDGGSAGSGGQGASGGQSSAGGQNGQGSSGSQGGSGGQDGSGSQGGAGGNGGGDSSQAGSGDQGASGGQSSAGGQGGSQDGDTPAVNSAVKFQTGVFTLVALAAAFVVGIL
ncbi:Collagen alpha-5(VI) chain [Fusarium albosuccineum]|uniref:Collagen alpha-5(VI) chain n=1 Tax=Fusarium albosuccineum TaxID=1237068 RepID=A0A8H4L2J7_9HYPO|nr:Collagen alpha-5(VI) chain [Fusarium albosuccineum]